jgi:hypothetical protein
VCCYAESSEEERSDWSGFVLRIFLAVVCAGCNYIKGISTLNVGSLFQNCSRSRARVFQEAKNEISIVLPTNPQTQKPFKTIAMNPSMQFVR